MFGYDDDDDDSNGDDADDDENHMNTQNVHIRMSINCHNFNNQFKSNKNEFKIEQKEKSSNFTVGALTKKLALFIQIQNVFPESSNDEIICKNKENYHNWQLYYCWF